MISLLLYADAHFDIWLSGDDKHTKESCYLSDYSEKLQATGFQKGLSQIEMEMYGRFWKSIQTLQEASQGKVGSIQAGFFLLST